MKTQITAHSGCENTPDNSFTYLQQVETVPGENFEFDVRRREDGILYLSHDLPDGDTPTLADAFAVIRRTGKCANCDLKEDGLELAVVEQARSMGVLDHIHLTGEVSRDLIRENSLIRGISRMNLQNLLPKELLHNPDQAVFETVLGLCRDCGVEMINPPYQFVTDEAIAFFAAHGIGISTWTVNTPEVARQLLNKGLVNITTRCPVMVAELRRELEG